MFLDNFDVPAHRTVAVAFSPSLSARVRATSNAAFAVAYQVGGASAAGFAERLNAERHGLVHDWQLIGAAEISHLMPSSFVRLAFKHLGTAIEEDVFATLSDGSVTTTSVAPGATARIIGVGTVAEWWRQGPGAYFEKWSALINLVIIGVS